MPSNGVQRGSLKLEGDLLTPGWSATGNRLKFYLYKTLSWTLFIILNDEQNEIAYFVFYIYLYRFISIFIYAYTDESFNYRLEISEAHLPKIPVLPISYGDAKILLQ